MTKPTHVKSLETLVLLRERAVERLRTELAAKERERQRYHANLDRMNGLCAGASSQGVNALALSLNFGQYKQALLQMADTHRGELARHEVDMAITQHALVSAAGKREVLGQVLDSRLQGLADARQRGDQKRQDEIATQAWARTGKR